MQKHIGHLTTAILILGVIVAACTEAAPPSGTASPTLSTNAFDIAKIFLDDWMKDDYAGMYGLISPKSQLISPKAFSDIYEQAEGVMKLAENGKAYELLPDQTLRQGDTTVVRYNMAFNSGPLGKFTDTNRTMRLVITPLGWRIAWSQMDIFEGMAGGAVLAVKITQSPRGAIYDRNGKVLAQSNTPNVAVRLVTNNWFGKTPEECLNKLAEVFHADVAILNQYLSYMRDKQDYGFTVGTLSVEQADQLRSELNAVCKLQYVNQISRFYYGNGLAAQTIGFVGSIPAENLDKYPGYPKDALVGRVGIEQTWEKELAGESGAQLVILAPDGTEIRSVYSKKPGPTQDITLSIDRDLQLSVEQALSSAYSVANWAQFSTGTAAVVLDTSTGEVLAMASYPSINPDAYRLDTTFDVNGSNNVLQMYQKHGAEFNRAIQGQYALGSVFKIVSMAAGADTRAFSPDSLYTCTGIWDGSKIGDQVRYDWFYYDKSAKDRFKDPITLTQALTASCDSYFWEVGAKLNTLDPTLFRQYANRMGLGVKTGMDAVFGLEPEGYIPDPTTQFSRTGKYWGIGNSLNTVIGQGDVQVTPLQVARMMVALANGGTLYRPYVIKSIGVPDQPPTHKPQISSPESIGLAPNVLQAIQKGLCNVTRDEKLGTAHFVFYNWNFDQISVCGKTGTAQTGSPYPNGWFAAYAGKPGQRPDIAVVVLVESSREGSETAGPIVRRIIENYYKLPMEPWPDYWSYPYELLPNPGVSDGSRPVPKP